MAFKSSAKIYGTLDHTDGQFDGTYFTVGACAVVEKSASFSCNAKFGTPPQELVADVSYDTSSPDLEVSCTNSSNSMARNLTGNIFK